MAAPYVSLHGESSYTPVSIAMRPYDEEEPELNQSIRKTRGARVSPLPAPEVDIMKTKHVRTFAEGSAGPQMDVLLFNQMSMFLMLADLRLSAASAQVGKSLPGSRRSSAVFDKTSDVLYTAVLEASIQYMTTGGTMYKTRAKHFDDSHMKWIKAITSNEHFMEAHGAAFNALPPDRLADMHMEVAKDGPPPRKTSKGKGVVRVADRGDIDSDPEEGARDAPIDLEGEEEEIISKKRVTPRGSTSGVASKRGRSSGP